MSERDEQQRSDGSRESQSAEQESPANGMSIAEQEAAERAAQDTRAARSESIAPEANKENTAHLLGERRQLSPVMSDDEAKRDINRRARRTFLIGGAAAIAGYAGYRYLWSTPDADGVPSAFRRAFNLNEQVSQAYFSPQRLAPEFPRSRVGNLRVNGGEGMSEGFDPSLWRLQVVGLANPRAYPQYTDNIAYMTAMDNMHAGEMNGQHENADAPDAKVAPGAMPPPTMDRAAAMGMQMPGLLLTLAELQTLPRVEMTTEFKCVEGWSTIVTWAGARLADFIAQYQPATRNNTPPDARHRPQDLVRYVSMVTPDGGYYVGLDMPSAMHLQTLLAYEMNGQPLTLPHGAPLRLVTPTKYGIKQIKRIGRIAFSDERPADFWAERGYDWYAGH
ncbi:MAG: molybdopterin-dependent oxidoreductase [Acidobacteriota bacterium]|nr:molybdopterin-dependent oxidoreductase [Acidobacteriota bacterium]